MAKRTKTDDKAVEEAKAAEAKAVEEAKAAEEAKAGDQVAAGHLRARCRDPQRHAYIRAGRRWGPDWKSIRIEDISEAQKRVLVADPLLEVEAG